MTAVRVTRDIAADEPHNCMGREVKAGEVFYENTLPEYGSVDHNDGIAVTAVEDEHPFYELPRDAVEVTP